MQLTEKIYWYPWEGAGNNCNSIFLKGEKNVLIDPGHVRNEFGQNCLENLKTQMEADGNSLDKVDLVLLTHGHPDHCEAAGVIAEQNGAKTAIYHEEVQVIEAVARMFGLKSPGSEDKPFLEPDILLEEGNLEVGSDMVIEVIHTPGHSPGAVTFFLSEEGALITGDVIFRGSIGRTDLPGGSMKDMANSVSRLSNLEGVKWLLPGHMDLVEGEQNVQRNISAIKSMFF